MAELEVRPFLTAPAWRQLRGMLCFCFVSHGYAPCIVCRPMMLKGYHPQFGRQQAPLPHNPRAWALVASKPFRCQVQDHRVHQKDGDALHEINTMNDAVFTEECMGSRGKADMQRRRACARTLPTSVKHWLDWTDRRARRRVPCAAGARDV